MDDLYKEFTGLAKALNSIGITPVLYGSLGLSKLIKHNLNPQDIDILVPESFLGNDWNRLKTLVVERGYALIDLDEHEFQKNGIKIAFASEEDLWPFANVDFRELEIASDAGDFKKLKLEDYLKVYMQSLKDGYRKTKNNNKDLEKINIIEKKLKQST